MLDDIDFDYLHVWGHHRTLIELRGRIHGRITDPTLNMAHLTSLGLCHTNLGDYRQAIDLHTQALAIAREIGDRQFEGIVLGNLGLCHASLGDYRQAIDLHTQALAIDRDIGNRHGEGADLGDLGNSHHRLGDYRQAIDLHTLALAIARDIGDRYIQGAVLTSLGLCHYRLGDYRQAIDLHTQALAIARDTGNRQFEGHDADRPGAVPCLPGRLPAGDRPAHPGAGHRPRHRRPLPRGIAALLFDDLAGVERRSARQAVAVRGRRSVSPTPPATIEPAVTARSWPGAGPAPAG